MLGTGTEGAIRRTGRATATALQRLGVHVDLAPVADVPGVPGSFVAATDRGFSTNPTRAAKGVTSFAAGLLDGGVAPTLKHFPGLGLATTSTDDAAVRITASEEALAPGFVPYRRAIAAGVVPLVMVSNAAYAAYGGQVAAWSPRVLSTLAGLGFTGATITDALEPLATTHHVTLGQAAVRAARAGVDLLLFVGSEHSTDVVYDQLLAAARDGRLPRAALEASAARSTSSPRPTRARFPRMRARRIGAAVLYGRSAVRIARRGRRRGKEERLVFVVGSPRSGTTITASLLGSLPGFVDLDEVQPWKAAIPELIDRTQDDSARRLRTILERVRRLAFAPGLRGVEQTPETSFVLGAALRAYPEAVAVHVIRDGRDVATSLLERGWLNSSRTGADDARLAYGSHPRFWVERDRRDEFSHASDATRAAWAWRLRRGRLRGPRADGRAALRGARHRIRRRRRPRRRRGARRRVGLVGDVPRARPLGGALAASDLTADPLVALERDAGKTRSSRSATRSKSSSRRSLGNDADPLELGEHEGDGLLRRERDRVRNYLGVVGVLVRVVDARKMRDLARERLRVEALDVPARALFERRLDPDLDERPLFLDERPDAPSRRVVGRNRRDHDSRPVTRQPGGDPADPLDVRVSVLVREAEALREMRAHHVAVEHLDVRAAPLELRREGATDRRLAGSRKPGQPDGVARIRLRRHGRIGTRGGVPQDCAAASGIVG